MSKMQINIIRFSLLSIWLIAMIRLTESPLTLIAEYGGFALLGVIGAIFANATGAGGGVIFVPFFSQLGLDNVTIVATSFGIQCFGMTAGAISWYVWFRKEKQQDSQWQAIHQTLLYTVPFSIAGIVLIQQLGWQSPNSLHMTFGAFSVFLAVAIFASIPLLKTDSYRHALTPLDWLCLPLTAFFGGMITAWLSVGVGELIAIYLIFRRFNVSFAIACAVILSAFSVWSGVVFHLLVTEKVYWFVVVFAGLGAVIGGSVARYVVLYFSATRLKLFFASWVFLIGVASIPL